MLIPDWFWINISFSALKKIPIKAYNLKFVITLETALVIVPFTLRLFN